MTINGEKMDFNEGITIKELIKKLNLNPETIVVEVNLNIISKSEYAHRKLSKEDRIEIINFVGGG
ncbi:sulfur carrier protein ThiS [Tepidibacter formicigenes]|jgi:sulfur carrier protein|uniref:Sulfur carrier protein n=1 Tax=Tepidibacter formicigenes DSM 15518 TaxID=1123349 RepID=A0A1M6KQ40_9FIRM|nr:sulfur carrier protein ThiS [Tepidibacter formicigenes]SHJ61041.1 sulfur carrier protein [Tepidibacter formicigenes DSM 15518]